MAEGSIKEQVAKRLQEKASIGSADIAELAAAEEKAEETEETVELEKNSADPLLKEAETGQPFQALDNNMAKAEKELGGQHLGLMGLSEVEITEEDKNAFLDCLVDGGRFEKRFSLFGGRVNGRFRSRTTEETTAILNEISRRVRKNPAMNDVEYSALLRHCVMAFQIASLDNVEYPPPSEPLKATYDEDSDSTIEPKWLARIDGYDKMSEGVEQALYAELMDFERVYWTLVQKAQDQNFWNPGDSTSD